VSPAPIPYVGDRLREERLRRGISVRSLARDLGVSASLISQIETGKSQPSVSTLYAMTSALGISVDEVFDAPLGDADGEASVPPAPLPDSLIGMVRSNRSGRVGPIVRPRDRSVLRLDSGVTWERLGHLPAGHVDFLLVTYDPGGTSASTGLPMSHAGTEYGYLLEGELVLTLGSDEHRLRPGDSLSFTSSTPHGYRNDGNVPAVGVWFVLDAP
jgi:transcriptional regulator with XRE-family HTH domain/quercetin dioxygenase-like cupin family protein